MTDTVEFEFKNGDKVRDKVTGFTGTITARVQFIDGCLQYCVLPPVDKDNKVQDAHYLDEARLELVGVNEENVVPRRTGGPKGSMTPPTR